MDQFYRQQHSSAPTSSSGAGGTGMDDFGFSSQQPPQSQQQQPFGQQAQGMGQPSSSHGHSSNAPPSSNFGAPSGASPWAASSSVPASAASASAPFGGNFGGSMSDLSGSMDGNMASPSTSDPNAYGTSSDFSSNVEPPLLEELGINFSHIRQKVISTLNPRRSIRDIVEDADLAGPLIFCVALGVLLSLRGKLHFDYIYHFFVFGSIFMYLVLKLLAHRTADDSGNEPAGSSGVDVLRVFSILGYSLLPIVLLAACSLLLDLQAWYGAALVILMICWSTYTSSRFFVAAMNAHKQRFLIGYPVLLFFTTFSLITIF
eukprot:INCI16781.1.p1 GENE.INCI16781.1~~INCI16781.1.p1  ORF type:complete len:317 (-),score=47.70 INCI16781.1:268-1218(-)